MRLVTRFSPGCVISIDGPHASAIHRISPHFVAYNGWHAPIFCNLCCKITVKYGNFSMSQEPPFSWNPCCTITASKVLKSTIMK